MSYANTGHFKCPVFFFAKIPLWPKILHVPTVCVLAAPPMAPQHLHTILERYERVLIRYVENLVGDVHSAQDVVQETFIRLIRRGHEQPGGWSVDAHPAASEAERESHLEAWLFTVSRNLAIDHQRKHRRIVPMPMPEDRPDGGVGPDDALAAREGASSLLKHLDLLSPNQKEVILLKFQNELSYKEISRITGLSVTNVGFLLHTGLKKLRVILEQEDQQPIRKAV